MPDNMDEKQGYGAQLTMHRETASGSSQAATTAMLHSDGRVTVPREIRNQLGLMPGDKLAFTLHNNGDLVAQKVNANPTGIPHRPDEH